MSRERPRSKTKGPRWKSRRPKGRRFSPLPVLRYKHEADDEEGLDDDEYRWVPTFLFALLILGWLGLIGSLVWFFQS